MRGARRALNARSQRQRKFADVGANRATLSATFQHKAAATAAMRAEMRGEQRKTIADVRKKKLTIEDAQVN